MFIVNPDTSIAETAIELLVTDFSRRPDNVMVLVPKIMIRQTDLINSIGMKRIRPSENLYTNIGYLEHDKGQFDIPQEVTAFDGSAFMFRKELLHHTYLFDVRFFFGNETVDLAERMSNLGLSAWTCPKAMVRHELRRNRRLKPLDDPMEEMDAPAPDPAPETPAAELSLLEQAVKEAVETRDAEERYLLAAYYLDGQTLLQIARVLGVHEATVSRKLKRAAEDTRKQVVRNLERAG